MEQLLIHTYEEFPDELRLQAVSFMRVEWPYIYSGERRLWMETFPSDLKPVHFCVTDGEVLLSHAEVVEAEFVHEGETLSVHGLGNVFTFPPFRRCGYGAQVVAAATSHTLEYPGDAAFLKTNLQLEQFYSAHGWMTLNDSSGSDAPDRPISMGILRSDRAKKISGSFQNRTMELPW